MSRHLTTLVGGDRAKLTDTLWEYLDEDSYTAAETALVGIEQAVADLGADEHARRFPFHVSALGDARSPFRALAFAILGSPAVKFNRRGIRMASLAGLSPLITAWEDAQRERARKMAKSTTPIGGGTGSSGLREKVQRLLDHEQSSLVKLTFTADVDVPGVRKVAYAFVNVRGGRKCYCTAQVRAMFVASDDEHGPQTLRLTRERVRHMLLEMKLLELPRPKRAYRFGDLTKGAVSRVGSLVLGPAQHCRSKHYHESNLSLVVAYVPFKAETKAQVAASLVTKLRVLGLVPLLIFVRLGWLNERSQSRPSFFVSFSHRKVTLHDI